MREAVRVLGRLSRFATDPLEVLCHPSYRLSPELARYVGVDARAAVFARDWLGDFGGSHLRFREPTRLALPVLQDALTWLEPRAPGVSFDTGGDWQSEEALDLLRISASGTLRAARRALGTGAASFNLLGGLRPFWNPGPLDSRGSHPLVDDVSVAMAALRREGFQGRVGLIDLTPGPPCAPRAFGVSSASWWWARLPEDEASDEGAPPARDGWRSIVRGLAHRAPELALLLIITGAAARDAADPTLDAARSRELRSAFWRVPTVWLGGAGAGNRRWESLACSVMGAAGVRLPSFRHDDPWGRVVRRVSKRLDRALEAGEASVQDGILQELKVSRGTLLLGHYSATSAEQALEAFGVLPMLRRRGFTGLRVLLDHDALGDRLRVVSENAGAEPLIECVLESRAHLGERVLFVHWLQLRAGGAPAGVATGLLPGQQSPGLGMAREAGALFAQVAQRLGLQGVSFVPAWYHTAWLALDRMSFDDPALHGRFLALTDLLRGLDLVEASRLVAEGGVWEAGRPYHWTAATMTGWLDARCHDPELVERARRLAASQLRFSPGSQALVPGG